MQSKNDNISYKINIIIMFIYSMGGEGILSISISKAHPWLVRHVSGLFLLELRPICLESRKGKSLEMLIDSMPKADTCAEFQLSRFLAYYL